MHVDNSRRLNWETFLVRLWRERVNGAWHGQIVHVASRESSYFATLAQAEAFISRFAKGIASQMDSRNTIIPSDSEGEEEQNVQFKESDMDSQ